MISFFFLICRKRGLLWLSPLFIVAAGRWPNRHKILRSWWIGGRFGLISLGSSQHQHKSKGSDFCWVSNFYEMGKMVEKAGRCLKTVFFMVAMLVSLLVSSLPVLVSIVDVFVPTFLLSSFTCLTCYTFNDHLTRYSFKTSLTDIPLVSLLRSFLVICMYPSSFLSLLFFF